MGMLLICANQLDRVANMEISPAVITNKPTLRFCLVSRTSTRCVGSSPLLKRDASSPSTASSAICSALAGTCYGQPTTGCCESLLWLRGVRRRVPEEVGRPSVSATRVRPKVINLTVPSGHHVETFLMVLDRTLNGSGD